MPLPRRAVGAHGRSGSAAPYPGGIAGQHPSKRRGKPGRGAP